MMRREVREKTVLPKGISGGRSFPGLISPEQKLSRGHPPLPLASLAAKAERKGILTAARNQAASVGSCVDAPDSGEVFIPQAILDIFPIIAPSRCLSFCDCIDRDTDHRVLVRWRRLSYEKCQRGKRSRTKIVPNTLRLKVTQEHEAPDSLVPIGERMILETK